MRWDAGAETSLARSCARRIREVAIRSRRTQDVGGIRTRSGTRRARRLALNSRSDWQRPPPDRRPPEWHPAKHRNRRRWRLAPAPSPRPAQRRDAARAVGDASRPCLRPFPRPGPFAPIVPPALPLPRARIVSLSLANFSRPKAARSAGSDASRPNGISPRSTSTYSSERVGEQRRQSGQPVATLRALGQRTRERVAGLGGNRQEARASSQRMPGCLS